MNRYFKTEGNILYPSKDDHNRPMLTWGPFYYHSIDKAKEKMDEILTWITNWVNEQDPSLNIQPESLIRTRDGRQIVFHIRAWKTETQLEKCDGIITIENIFFEDEQ